MAAGGSSESEVELALVTASRCRLHALKRLIAYRLKQDVRLNLYQPKAEQYWIFQNVNMPLIPILFLHTN